MFNNLYCLTKYAVFTLTHLLEAGTSKSGFGQVKIIKEFV